MSRDGAEDGAAEAEDGPLGEAVADDDAALDDDGPDDDAVEGAAEMPDGEPLEAIGGEVGEAEG